MVTNNKIHRYDPEQEPSKKYVLFIDSDDLLLGLIEKELEDKEELNFVGEKNAKVGLEKAKEIEPNVIVLDLLAEGLSGEMLLNEIQESPQLEDTKIMILSKKIEDEHIHRYKELGIDDFIQKPFNMSELIFRLEKLT